MTKEQGWIARLRSFTRSQRLVPQLLVSVKDKLVWVKLVEHVGEQREDAVRMARTYSTPDDETIESDPLELLEWCDSRLALCERVLGQADLGVLVLTDVEETPDKQRRQVAASLEFWTEARAALPRALRELRRRVAEEAENGT